MRKNHACGLAVAVLLCTAAITRTIYPAQAADASQTVVYDGVTIGPVEVGGMTKEEAKQAVEAYVAELLTKNITLSLEEGDGKQIEAAIADMGLAWANPEVIDQIDHLDKSGNVIRRYKARKDIANAKNTFDLEFSVDEAMIRAVIEANLSTFEVPAVDAVMQKTENGFSITPEQAGSTLDVEASVQAVKSYLTTDWNQESGTVKLAGAALEAAVTKAECEKVQAEPMAEFTTSYTSSGSARSGNIDTAVGKINGTVLMPGEAFSCLEHMVPFTEENGYFPAGSYYNGMLVDSFGGGVCQVSTTLYNAVLLAELEVNQRYNHGLTVSYVQLSSDAAIAESSGMDLVFTNNTNAPVYIEGYTQNKTVTFALYGMDERPANRTVEYKNVVIEVINPPEDVITEDSSLAAGTRKVTQSSHTGYRAELYKYVYVDGEQVSKEKVNSSYYAPAPNYVSVGPDTVTEAEPESPADIPADVVPTETQPMGEPGQETAPGQDNPGPAGEQQPGDQPHPGAIQTPGDGPSAGPQGTPQGPSYPGQTDGPAG